MHTREKKDVQQTREFHILMKSKEYLCVCIHACVHSKCGFMCTCAQVSVHAFRVAAIGIFNFVGPGTIQGRRWGWNWERHEFNTYVKSGQVF